MARPYETVYIFDSTLEETEISARLERFHKLLGGPDVIQNVAHWGKRTLAYPIHKHTSGYYVVAQMETDPSKLPEYERALKLDEGVLRSLTVVSEGTSPLPAATSDEAVRLKDKDEDADLDSADEEEL